MSRRIQDHGGSLNDAVASFGGAPGDWLDLSTGINPRPYPVPELPPASWTRLPEAADIAALEAAAARAYEAAPEARVLAAPGASALIAALPRLAQPARVAIPGPTYSEHAAAFYAAGWEVIERPGPGVTATAIVNPNNPDGRRWSASELQVMAQAMDLLVVDESFMDPTPADALAPYAGEEGLVVLRSFGKFYGLPGLRLGFAITGPQTAARLGAALGPWQVSGAAVHVGQKALQDVEWLEETRLRLAADRARLTELANAAGWQAVGGSDLFQTFETPDAVAARERLAAARIWSRIFPYSRTWLRLGLPGNAADWARLEGALI
ncbi:MAG: threonine-phosphate decarboxylase CobD [Pseudomonadota bacterium]